MAAKAIWTPQPGPQEFAFYNCMDIDEVMYGGARGGGKTSYLLGDYGTQAAEYKSFSQGIICRKSYPQLEEVVMQGKEMYCRSGIAKYNKSDSNFYFKNGAILRLRHLDRLQDVENYHGHQYCVGAGTPVLMASGKWKPIEDIKPGELVQTLQGPSEVTYFHDNGIKPCVMMKTSVCGHVFEQIQSLNHSVLSIPSECSYGHQVSRQSQKCSLSWTSYESLLRDHLSNSGASSLSIVGRNFYAVSVDGLLISQPLPSLFFQSMIYAPDPRSDDSLQQKSIEFDGAACNHSCCTQDVMDSRQASIPSRLLTYYHPYLGEPYQPLTDLTLSHSSLIPIGERQVFDITVANHNHFITRVSISRNSWIGYDEATNFKDFRIFERMRACARTSKPGVKCVIRYTGNPGGTLHNEIKAYFIDPEPLGRKVITNAAGKKRIFVPSKVTDNLLLMKNDPDYIKYLESITDPELRKAWLDGDWDVALGSFFGDVFKRDRHVIPNFPQGMIPKHWNRYRAFDWGSAKPFCCLWYTIARDDIEIGGRYFPNGSIIFYREYYGLKKGEFDVGLKMTSTSIAREIKRIEFQNGETNVRPGPADTAIWKVEDGPSIAEKMAKEGARFIKSDKSRVTGWEQVRIRLEGYDKPLLYFTENCVASIRTLPVLPRDEKKWDDIETLTEDHCLPGSTIIATNKGQKPLASVTVDDRILTRFGYRKVLRCWLTAKDTPLLELQTTNGEIRTTFGHKLFVLGMGFLPVSEIHPGMELLHITPHQIERLQSVMGCDLTGIPAHRNGLKKHIMYLKGILENSVSPDYTNMSLSDIMAPCPTGMLYTTLMRILKTTTLKILLPYLKVSIPLTISPSNRNGHSQISQDEKQPSGINHLREELGTENALSISKVKAVCLAGAEDVYNITAEEVHEYFSEGFLSRNCADTIRYVCMSYPMKPPGKSMLYLPEDNWPEEVIDPIYGS